MRIASLFSPLRRSFSHPRLRRLLRLAGWLATGAYFAFAVLVLALRYAVLPQIDHYRGDIESALSHALRLPVTIRAVDAGWAGLRPRLAIHGFDIRDAAGRPALGFDNVEAELGWSSLWHLELRLHRLEIVAPDLDVRRDAAGRYFVAGLEMAAAGADNGFSEWLLSQERIVVRDAAIRWHDELRAVPVLALQHVNVDLQSSGNRHRFGFTAEPPAALAARLDLRGDFRGRDLNALEAWKGDVYAELDYADLAVWRTWVDYPVELPRGSGGLRLWSSFAAGQATGATADVRLADVQVRLGAELPMLELTRLEGRLTARWLADGFEAEAKHLALETRDGVHIDPTGARLRYRTAAAKRPAGGEFSTNGLDVGALAALSAYLPLPDGVRAQLGAAAPRGLLRDVMLSWSGEPENLQSWRLKGGFTALGLAAQGAVPGFSGLSGTLEGDEKGGSLSLDSTQAALELPKIFAEPKLPLAAVSGKANWKLDAAGLSVELPHLSFENQDAAGEASGRYRWNRSGGPGEIDLTAHLKRAAGGAVSRYLPLAVSKDVRDWLKAALSGGKSEDTSLRLQGNLAQFPFKGGKDGLFQVKGHFRGATLRYAPSWPELRDVDGELLFEGARMLIQGQKGSILGVGIGPVRAEIEDLDAQEPLLTVAGRAAGPTADFLKFIEASPVGEHIDHFTEEMRASGNGELNLKLGLPLHHLADSRIDGRYRFVGNELVPDPDLPPLTEVHGELHFTGERMEAQKVRATLVGMPMTVDIATAGDGSVSVKAAGSVAVRTLKQQLPGPLLDNLSGTAPWTGSVKVRKKNAEVRIESSLQGIASSLPEPFNKTGNDVLPLVVERRNGAAPGRDQLLLSLGDVLKAQLLRRHDKGVTTIERGTIAVGATARLPERGVALAVQAKRLDLDVWRNLLAGSGGGNGGSSGGTGGNGGSGKGGAAPVLPINQVDLRVDDLQAFGRHLTGLRLTGTQSGELWKADLRSTDASGHLEWNGQGAGRISGHLTRLALVDTADGKTAAGTTVSTTTDMPDEMPAIDLVVDRFLLHNKDFGALKIKAENSRDGYWNAKLDLHNDDANLSGEGRWRPSPSAPDTRLDFKLAVKSVEKLLVRLGYPDAVRRGTANLEGSLAWNGAPVAIDYPSLSGKMKFEATAGQFNKLEPGVGRLLGVLSLQSLPRRLTLDFRDVFSEGFAFDAMAGEASVTRGIMETRNLQIAGPAAKVLMSGSVNLGAETQDLKVSVQPALGETIATGVLLAHPATGAAAWVINKLFGNPFDHAFAFDYVVTGSWDDPRVEKVGGPAKDAAGSKDAANREGTPP